MDKIVPPSSELLEKLENTMQSNREEYFASREDRRVIKEIQEDVKEIEELKKIIKPWPGAVPEPEEKRSISAFIRSDDGANLSLGWIQDHIRFSPPYYTDDRYLYVMAGDGDAHIVDQLPYTWPNTAEYQTNPFAGADVGPRFFTEGGYYVQRGSSGYIGDGVYRHDLQFAMPAGGRGLMVVVIESYRERARSLKTVISDRLEQIDYPHEISYRVWQVLDFTIARTFDHYVECFLVGQDQVKRIPTPGNVRSGLARYHYHTFPILIGSTDTVIWGPYDAGINPEPWLEDVGGLLEWELPPDYDYPEYQRAYGHNNNWPHSSFRTWGIMHSNFFHRASSNLMQEIYNPLMAESLLGRLDQTLQRPFTEIISLEDLFQRAPVAKRCKNFVYVESGGPPEAAGYWPNYWAPEYNTYYGGNEYTHLLQGRERRNYQPITWAADERIPQYTDESLTTIDPKWKELEPGKTTFENINLDTRHIPPGDEPEGIVDETASNMLVVTTDWGLPDLCRQQMFDLGFTVNDLSFDE